MRECAAVYNRCAKVSKIFTLSSNIANHSFNLFVSFSIYGFKRKRRKFKFLFLLRRNGELF